MRSIFLAALFVITAAGNTHAQSSANAWHWDVAVRLLGKIGVGADMTMYYVPVMRQESYAAPLSFHAFVRYRFGTAPAAAEHHH